MKKWKMKSKIYSLKRKIRERDVEIERLKIIASGSLVEQVAAQRDALATMLHEAELRIVNLEKENGG